MYSDRNQVKDQEIKVRFNKATMVAINALAHCVCGWSQFVSGKALIRPRAFTPNVGIK